MTEKLDPFKLTVGEEIKSRDWNLGPRTDEIQKQLIARIPLFYKKLYGSLRSFVEDLITEHGLTVATDNIEFFQLQTRGYSDLLYDVERQDDLVNARPNVP